MRFRDITDALECRAVYKSSGYDGIVLHRVVASDLMSDVLTTDHEGILLVTSLCTDQAIRTADIVGAQGILFVNGKNIFDSMTALAAELDISILQTKIPKFEACVRLGRILDSVHHV